MLRFVWWYCVIPDLLFTLFPLQLIWTGTPAWQSWKLRYWKVKRCCLMSCKFSCSTKFFLMRKVFAARSSSHSIIHFVLYWHDILFVLSEDFVLVEQHLWLPVFHFCSLILKFVSFRNTRLLFAILSWKKNWKRHWNHWIRVSSSYIRFSEATGSCFLETGIPWNLGNSTSNF